MHCVLISPTTRLVSFVCMFVIVTPYPAHLQKLAELDEARQAEKRRHEELSALRAQTREAKRLEAEENQKVMTALDLIACKQLGKDMVIGILQTPQSWSLSVQFSCCMPHHHLVLQQALTISYQCPKFCFICMAWQALGPSSFMRWCTGARS